MHPLAEELELIVSSGYPLVYLLTHEEERGQRLVVEALKEKNAADIPVFGGGIIPIDDIPGLKKAGIREIFQPGTTIPDIVQFIEKLVHEKR